MPSREEELRELLKCLDISVEYIGQDANPYLSKRTIDQCVVAITKLYGGGE